MKKRLLALLMVSSMVLAGCSMEEQPENKQENYSIRVYNKDELENGFYYIKHGDEFYQIKDGFSNFKDNQETDYDYSVQEEEQPDGTRSFFYGRDKSEKTIPTMYQGDELIYKSQNNIESVFEWERFVDAGYTFGIRGIEKADSGAYVFTNYCLNIFADTPFAEKIGRSDSAENENMKYSEDSDYKEGEEATQESPKDSSQKEEESENVNLYWKYTISDIKSGQESMEKAVSSSAVSGSAISEPLSSEILSPCGTIQGLNPDTEYTVDVHKGTKLYQIKTKPDARVFYNFENYWTKGVSFSEDGYAIIAVPEAFKSGYYKCNNSGLFRYVDEPYHESFDLSTVNFNKAYYKREKREDGTYEDIQYRKIVMNEYGFETESDEYVYE